MFAILFDQELYFIYQGNFFIPILEAVDQLAKNVQAMVHKFIMIHNEVCTF